MKSTYCRSVHKDGLFGAQQNRGLKFSTEVRAPPEPEVFSDTLSLNDEDVGPRVYESDTSSRSSSYHKRERYYLITQFYIFVFKSKLAF